MSSLRALARLAAPLLAVAGCAAPHDPHEPVAEVAAPIINGVYDPDDPAVVALLDQSGVFCTGTLASRHVVVTAGHCVTWGGPKSIFFGSDPAQGGKTVSVQSYQAHPQFDASTLDADIGVVILAQAAPDEVLPVPIATEAPTVGATARFIGFGFTQIGPSGGYGRKYVTSAPITKVNPRDFEYGVATCNGDSGGPALLTIAGREVLSGVTSWGDETCAQFGVDTRVDAFRTWLEARIDAVDPATCDADGRCASGCGAPDPDCPCAGDGHCTAACAAAGADPDCPAECAGENVCREDCPARDPDCPVVGVGEPCDSDFDCGDNVCEGVCRPLCDPAAPMCPDGLSCDEAGAGKHACLEGGGGGGGCAVAERRGGGWPATGLAWLLGGLAILLARRRAARDRARGQARTGAGR